MNVTRFVRWKALALLGVLLAVALSATVYAHHGDCDSDRYVFCGSDPFSHLTVESDGDYTLDWSDWDGDNSDVTGYSISRNRIIYRSDLKYTEDVTVNGESRAEGEALGTDPEDQVDREYLFTPGSCESAVDNPQTPTYKWDCSTFAVNLYQDPNGNRTTQETLATRSDITDWDGRLSSPGKEQDQEFTVWTLPSTLAAPTGLNQTLSESAVTVTTLSADEIEMHLYFFRAHRSDNTSSIFTTSVDGANGFAGGL